MSADNGIYILKCKDQYRVIHAQAIDNLWWTYLTKSSEGEMVPTRIVEYFGKSKYTRNQDLARSIAFSMAKHTPVLEYGINEFEINKTWNQIVKEAKELAVKEIEIVKRYEGGKWGWDIKLLEEIIAM